MSALNCEAASPQRVADPNAQQMADMIRAFWISQIVGTLARLGIPDRLAGRRTCRRRARWADRL